VRGLINDNDISSRTTGCLEQKKREQQQENTIGLVVVVMVFDDVP